MVNIQSYMGADGNIVPMNAMELETDSGRRAAKSRGVILNQDALGINRDVINILADVHSSRRAEEDIDNLLRAVHEEEKKDEEEKGGGGLGIAV